MRKEGRVGGIVRFLNLVGLTLLLRFRVLIKHRKYYTFSKIMHITRQKIIYY